MGYTHRVALGFALLALSAGCSAPVSGTYEPSQVEAPALATDFELDSGVAISADFTPEEVEGITAALEAWHTATGGAVSLHAVIGGSAPLVIDLDDTLAPGATGGTYGKNTPHTRIGLSRAMLATVNGWDGSPGYVAVVQGTVAHELGHAFGLVHLPGGLMKADHCPTSEPIDAEAVAALCDLRRCAAP